MNIAWQYFPGREGLIAGLIDTSYGLGAAMYGNVLNSLINPAHVEMSKGTEYPYADDVADNVPSSLRALAYIWIGHIVVCIALMQGEPDKAVAKRFHPKYDSQQSAIGDAHYDEVSRDESSQKPQESKKKTFRSLYKYLNTNQFITMWTMTFLSINMSTFMIGNFQQFASEHITD